MTISPLSQRSLDFGITMTRTGVEPGESFWQLVDVVGPQDIGGNHHLYVDAWDEQGNRVVGAKVIFYSRDEEWEARTEAKPGESQAVNLPLFAGGNSYGVRMGDLPSDDVFGFGLGKNIPHHSFRAIFQRAIADGQPEPPAPPVDPPPDLNELRVAFMQIQAIAAAALKRMETM